MNESTKLLGLPNFVSRVCTVPRLQQSAHLFGPQNVGFFVNKPGRLGRSPAADQRPMVLQEDAVKSSASADFSSKIHLILSHFMYFQQLEGESRELTRLKCLW